VTEEEAREYQNGQVLSVDEKLKGFCVPVLDGMNLFEDDVRLLVVRRSIDGYTKTNRVTLKDDMTMPLSEAWVKGFIGGLPDNF